MYGIICRGKMERLQKEFEEEEKEMKERMEKMEKEFSRDIVIGVYLEEIEQVIGEKG